MILQGIWYHPFRISICPRERFFRLFGCSLLESSTGFPEEALLPTSLSGNACLRVLSLSVIVAAALRISVSVYTGVSVYKQSNQVDHSMEANRNLWT